ncbi:MAG: hypothetical protein IKE70_01250, partial [Bacilli bacterium]|nr:hypothetical protein [Bacilli bacterium]
LMEKEGDYVSNQQEEVKFYSLMSDTTFKYLFKNPKTRFFFQDIIFHYTGIDVEDFELLDNELNSGNQYVNYRVDIILANKDKSKILNVELNREHERYTELRNRRYLHTLAGTSKDSTYQDDRKVNQLNLNGYSCSRNKQLSRETYRLHDIENDIVLDDFIIHNIYLLEEQDLCYNESVRKKLKLFLCKSYEEMKEVIKEDKELMIIMNEIERLNQDKFFGGLYNIEEEQKKMENTARRYGFDEGKSIGIEEGKSIGIEEGKTLGIEEGKTLGIEEGKTLGSNEKAKKIAVNLYQNGVDIQTILKSTSLSKEEFDEILKNH